MEPTIVYVAGRIASSTPIRNHSAAVPGAVLARLIGRTVPILLQPEVPRRHGSPSKPEFFDALGEDLHSISLESDERRIRLLVESLTCPK